MLRNAGHLLSANVVAQAVGILVYPLLSRIYCADDFGLVNLFLSIGGVLVLLSTAEYQYAVVLPRTDRGAMWCMQGAMRICFATVLFTLIVVLAVPHWLSGVFAAPQLSSYLWLLPLYVLVMGGWTLCNAWYLRHDGYRVMSGYQVGQSLCGAVLKIVGGVAKVLGGLIYASVLAPLLSLVATLWRHPLPRHSFLGLACADRRGVRAAMSRYYRFPLFSLPKSLLDSVSGYLPTFVVAPTFGLAATGLLGMSLTLAFRPINVICTSLNQAYYQRCAVMHRDGESIRPLFRRHVLYSVVAAVPVFTLLWFVLPELCAWLLGNEWEPCGHLIRWMLPWLLMVLVATPLNYIPDIYDRQRGHFVFQVVRVVVQTIVLIYGVANAPMVTAMGLYFSAGAFILALETVWYYSISR